MPENNNYRYRHDTNNDPDLLANASISMTNGDAAFKDRNPEEFREQIRSAVRKTTSFILSSGSS